MRPSFDPMAGESARAIQADPAAPQPILDPTDPRYGELAPPIGEPAGPARQAWADPTDPAAGRRPERERPRRDSEDPTAA